MTDENQKPAVILWHKWFGDLFRLCLAPFGIEVKTEFPVMKEPPEADIVIIRKPDTEWTSEELKFVPDGIRESKARHIIIEFKYTESVNEDALCQILGYRIFYKLHEKLDDKELQSFLISSKTPEPSTLKKYGYTSEKQAGIYVSKYPLLKLIHLISLNDLPNKPHNLLVRLFASKQKEKISALKSLKYEGIVLSENLKSYIRKFLEILVVKGGAAMDDPEFKLTPEEVSELAGFVVSYLSAEEILAKFTPKERMAGLSPKDWMKELSQQELDEIEKYLLKLRGKG